MMPHKFMQNENGANTTRQKGLRNKHRTGRSSYSVKGKAKYADRYTRPYLTGEYRDWPTHYTDNDPGMATYGRPATGHNKSKRTSRGINSAH